MIKMRAKLHITGKLDNNEKISILIDIVDRPLHQVEMDSLYTKITHQIGCNRPTYLRISLSIKDNGEIICNHAKQIRSITTLYSTITNYGMIINYEAAQHRFNQS